MQSEYDEEKEQLLSNCYVRKFKKNRKLDSNFPELKTGLDDVSCESLTREAEKDMLKVIRKEIIRDLKKIKEMTENKKCKMTYVTRFIWHDYVLTFIKFGKESSDDELLHQKIAEAVEEASLFCTFGEEFAEFFDVLIKQSKAWGDDDLGMSQKSYCARKIAAENKLMDSQYRLEVNAKNITTDIECNFVLLPVIADWFEKILCILRSSAGARKIVSNKASQCIVTALKDFKYIGKFFAVCLLNEFEISGEQLDEERKEFDDFMIDAISTILKDFCDT